MQKILLTAILSVFWIVSFSQVPMEAIQKKLQSGDFASAKSELTKIIDTNPKNKEALNLRGQARAGLSDFYGAISDFTFALETDSTFAEALNNRGEAKMNL